MNEQDGFAVSRRAPASPRRSGRAGRRGRDGSYSRSEILEAVMRWSNLYGAPPTMCDWEPSRARRTGQQWRADRFEAGSWPSARVVTREFGTFNDAIESAGLTPRKAPTRQTSPLADASAILDAMLAWTRRYGDIPTMADWDPARARRLKQDWRIARYYQGDWPSARSVAHHFSSFASAATAAGLVPRTPGSHHDQRQSEQLTNRTVAARAARESITPGMVDLGASLKALARARITDDPVSMHGALIDLAGSALAWASVFGSE
jgi:hypothetical protein